MSSLKKSGFFLHEKSKSRRLPAAKTMTLGFLSLVFVVGKQKVVLSVEKLVNFQVLNEIVRFFKENFDFLLLKASTKEFSSKFFEKNA